jgi:hypothetical protein
MLIPVVLSGGQEDLVSKEELQFLRDVHQVELFKRSDGWVFVGQDEMRHEKARTKVRKAGPTRTFRQLRMRSFHWTRDRSPVFS